MALRRLRACASSATAGGELTIHAVSASSNADAAKRLQHEWHAAAIAGDIAAEIYGLEKLAASDLPNLWKPKADAFVRLEAFPMLGTGKLDLRKVKELASQLSTNHTVAPA